MCILLSTTLLVMKRKIGELSIVRRKEQESVEPELKKLAARTVKAQWTNWQVCTYDYIFSCRIGFFLI